MTEDVQAKYKEWSERGVHFLFAPETPGWGGVYARFEDPDGNAFGLEGFDEVKRSLELRRQAHAEKLEAEGRAAQELEIARQVPSAFVSPDSTGGADPGVGGHSDIQRPDPQPPIRSFPQLLGNRQH